MNYKKITILCIILLTSVNIMSINAQATDTLYANYKFSKAIEAYNKEQFNEAVYSFQELYDEGYKNFELLYNLGNSYFRINDYPNAILYYERALNISPENEDVKYNLSIANSRIIDKIDTIPTMFHIRWWKAFNNCFSIKTWNMLNILLFAVTALCIMFLCILKNITVKKTFFKLSIAALILFLITVSVNISLKKQAMSSDKAIIFTPTVTAKGSPIDNGVDIFVIHKGTKVIIRDNVGDWVEIMLLNGSTGWIKSSDIRVI